eukprot:GHUV01026931.1.p1 GENE.GHUV01026931.1~~GHUV01026931.1.p1  ORF type:complete len:125 (+),score=29.83 GHUV01026931.1:839-1213(+)
MPAAAFESSCCCHWCYCCCCSPLGSGFLLLLSWLCVHAPAQPAGTSAAPRGPWLGPVEGTMHWLKGSLEALMLHVDSAAADRRAGDSRSIRLMQMLTVDMQKSVLLIGVMYVVNQSMNIAPDSV